MTMLVIAALPCLVWLYLLAARGGFWHAAPDGDAAQRSFPVGTWPRVVAVIPARDEAPVIGGTIDSLLHQNYAGELSLIVVDDHSADGTAAMARAAALRAGAPERVLVIAAPDLPDGWTGKLWALHHGMHHAENVPSPPDYFLLTDADIRYTADTLTSLVRRSVNERLLLMSLMAQLHCASWIEHAFIPAFVFFFRMLYPFAWVGRTDRATAAAAGGCMLVQRNALESAGGIRAIRGELIDDCALARLLKPHGPIGLALTRRVTSVRAYETVGEIRSMISRCAYTQLRCSPWWLAIVTGSMTIIFLLPPVIAAFGHGAPQWLGLIAWAMMALAFQPILRFCGVSCWWGPALPIIAGAYLVFTIDSAWQHARGAGGVWKGRVHRGTRSDAVSGDSMQGRAESRGGFD